MLSISIALLSSTSFFNFNLLLTDIPYKIITLKSGEYQLPSQAPPLLSTKMSTRITEFGLRAFPPEILELIFTPLLTFTGKTPPLLVALRADPQLYQEALSTFRKLNTFKLHRGNKWMTGDMNPSAIQSIRALTVDFWSVTPLIFHFGLYHVLCAPTTTIRSRQKGKC